MSRANHDLFAIEEIVHKQGAISARLLVNPASDILKGHFPGHAVVPGACMLQIIKEILENALGRGLRLARADHLKFIALIDPAKTLSVEAEISYQLPSAGSGALAVNAKLSNADIVYFKLQGYFL